MTIFLLVPWRLRRGLGQSFGQEPGFRFGGSSALDLEFPCTFPGQYTVVRGRRVIVEEREWAGCVGVAVGRERLGEG
jgi:hypothetical protein